MIEGEVQPQEPEENQQTTHRFNLWSNDREREMVETVMKVGITATKVGIAAVLVEVAIRLTVGEQVNELTNKHLPKVLAKVVRFML